MQEFPAKAGIDFPAFGSRGIAKMEDATLLGVFCWKVDEYNSPKLTASLPLKIGQAAKRKSYFPTIIFQTATIEWRNIPWVLPLPSITTSSFTYTVWDPELNLHLPRWEGGPTQNIPSKIKRKSPWKMMLGKGSRILLRFGPFSGNEMLNCSQGIVGCTPGPTYSYGKSLYKPYIVGIYGL